MKIEINKLLENYRKGLLPEFRVEVGKIKDFNHLQFLTKEIIPKIETTIR